MSKHERPEVLSGLERIGEHLIALLVERNLSCIGLSLAYAFSIGTL
jgi:hypothetical protein